jgi:hypothetical protein
MSEENRNPEGFRSEECSPPGRGLYPMLRPQEGEKGMEADVNTGKLNRMERTLGPRKGDEYTPKQHESEAFRT